MKAGLEAGLGLEDLAAAIGAGLQVDVMRPVEFARILVLDISGPGLRMPGAAEAAFHGRGLSLRYGHRFSPEELDHGFKASLSGGAYTRRGEGTEVPRR